MAERLSHKDQVAKRAGEAFKSAERRDTASKEIIETERTKTAVKTTKLRALRLAKEAADLKAKEDDMANRKRRR